MTQASPETAPSPSTVNPVDDRPLVYVNGQLVPRSQAAINVFDHGLLYGDGVFEGIRVYRGRIFKLQQHMDRLYRSAAAIRLDLEKHVPRDKMIAIQRRCVEANELTDGYIRLVVTRGVGTLGLHPFKCPTPGIICIADQISLYPPELYKTGMRVVVANRPRIPIANLDPRVKSLNYLNNVLAKIEAIDLDCLEVIMLNNVGRVAECSGDNIFIVKDGAIVTPPTDEGILEGITRRFVLDTVAPGLGIPAEEKRLVLDDVLGADEVFLTGSAAEIIAVTQIDQHIDGEVTSSHRISDGEGPITEKLRKRFREIVTSDMVPED